MEKPPFQFGPKTLLVATPIAAIALTVFYRFPQTMVALAGLLGGLCAIPIINLLRWQPPDG